MGLKNNKDTGQCSGTRTRIRDQQQASRIYARNSRTLAITVIIGWCHAYVLHYIARQLRCRRWTSNLIHATTREGQPGCFRLRSAGQKHLEQEATAVFPTGASLWCYFWKWPPVHGCARASSGALFWNNGSGQAVRAPLSLSSFRARMCSP